MKKFKLILVTVFVASSFIMNAQNLKVDAEKSSIEWIGKKVGGEHNGNIKLKSGAMEIKSDQIVSGNFVIDMESMTNIDLGSDEYKQKLIGHLKSDDFWPVIFSPFSIFSRISFHKPNFVSGSILLKLKLAKGLFGALSTIGLSSFI